ncbi:MAG: UTP--glucose-1-phosphate uridylyltransferase GalU [Proteobacteria bacterium]|nr:UTP--glucose-1-phosphate uridylyltransferase GalU [Pseudomonadota bacterium]
MILKKVVFPAAGLGTRFLPVTKCIPKEMLPIVDKPLIQYGVEEALSAGFKDVIIVTGRGKNAIEDYFDYSFELEYILSQREDNGNLEEITKLPKEVDVAYVRQKKPLGLGHAILCAENLISSDEYFGVVLSDDIIDAKVPVLKQMVEIVKKYKAPVISLMEVDKTMVNKYGIIKGKEIEERVYELNDMIEKPKVEDAPSNLAIIGRYILPAEIFSYIKKVKPGKNGEIQLTDALRDYAKKKRILGYIFEGTRYDAGDKFGYLHANIMFGLKRRDIGDKIKKIIKC